MFHLHLRPTLWDSVTEIFMTFFVRAFKVFTISFFFFILIMIPFLIWLEIDTQISNTANVKLNQIAIKKEKIPLFLEDFRPIEENLASEKKSFLEINLQKMEAEFYQEGILKNVWPIAARGDVQDWGGTAAGLYQILSKNRSAFSVLAEVNMPWAVHYYGLFYLHGVPFYGSGERRITEATGGCIQFSNKDAEIIYQIAEKGMSLLVIDTENDDYRYSLKKPSQLPKVSAQSYLVADLDSGFVFAQKDWEKEFSIASLTKLMTAVIVAENSDRRKSITVQPFMLSKAYGGTSGLEIGKSFRVVELFYPLLIESSNDAAEVLSYFLGRDTTIGLMNEKTKSILMEKTKFNDPNGLDLGNISTAKDLFYLIRYIANNYPLLLGITRGDSVRAFGEVRFKNLQNKNIFFDNPYFLGGKTGAAVDKSYSGIFVFSLPVNDGGAERRIAIILLDSEGLENDAKSLKKDTEQIFSWLQENYLTQNISM